MRPLLAVLVVGCLAGCGSAATRSNSAKVNSGKGTDAWIRKYENQVGIGTQGQAAQVSIEIHALCHEPTTKLLEAMSRNRTLYLAGFLISDKATEEMFLYACPDKWKAIYG
jgi:hypothetical protein